MGQRYSVMGGPGQSRRRAGAGGTTAAAGTVSRQAGAPRPRNGHAGHTHDPRLPRHAGVGSRRPHREHRLDNLTHSLVGAAIGKAGAERTTPLATATLIVAANAPDVDVLSFVGGEYFALASRRGITHGWLALPVLALAVAATMLGWDRWVRRRRDRSADPADPRWILGLSAAGLLTHPALDWLNIYGMRWWMPFDGAWTYGDSLFIVDPWLWLALGGALFLASAPARGGMAGWMLLAALTTALVVGGVGGWPAIVWALGLSAVVTVRVRNGRGGEGRRTGTLRVVGVASLVYVGAMIASSRAARADVLAAARDAGLAAEDVLVAPVRGDPFGAEVEVLTGEAYVPGSHHWLRSPRVRLRAEHAVPLLDVPTTPDVPTTLNVPTTPGVPTTPDLPAMPDATGGSAYEVRRVIAVARARPAVASYLVWARFPYVRVTPDADGWQVRFGDARYDSQPETGGLAGLTVHVSRADIP